MNDFVINKQQISVAKNTLSVFYRKGLTVEPPLLLQLTPDQTLLLAATHETESPNKLLILELPIRQYLMARQILASWCKKWSLSEQWHLLDGELTPQEINADISSDLSASVHHLLLGSPGHNFLVPLAQANINLPAAVSYRAQITQVNIGEYRPRQKIIDELIAKGYWRTSGALAPGSFKVRGEQIDLKHPAGIGYHTLTLFRSVVEKIDYTEKNASPVRSFQLPPNNFPPRQVPLRQHFRNQLIIHPASIQLHHIPSIIYDALHPARIFPVVNIPAGLRLRQPATTKKLANRQGMLLATNLAMGKPAVHSDHGIGIYEGLQRRKINQQSREYLILRYAAGDQLSVPVEFAYKVTAYLGGETPPIHRLGGSVWRKTSLAAQQDAAEFAQNLLATARKRAASNRLPYRIDPAIEDNLAASFPYQLTADQAQSWQAVKNNLSSENCLDHLIIGDVGFGKTELAIRAARHVAANHKQVAVLAPTTLLVQQHTDTFRSRLNDMFDSIGTLSRFTAVREKKILCEQINSGQLLIVIGTHALLSQQIHWPNLGLVIIDEEQRFGVAQKEHFKKLRASVDILSLSATPIPRTLAMSLAGMKQLSVIGTAPAGRKSVSTYVGPQNDPVLRQAVKHELNRRGQVYLIAPKIRQLSPLQTRLSSLVPQARSAIIHGRLPGNRVAGIMRQFDRGAIDVLVSSTIIENGLDLPNVNTIIVTSSTQFGLSDLYQLRGRIGRRDKKGQAYFLYNQAELTAVQRQRLTALTEASRLGSGWALAQRDLEIRGAGNILGAEQSGTVKAVGVQLYLDMVREAVNQYEHKYVRRQDVDILLPLPSGLPPDYISSIQERVNLYQRLSRAVSLDELAGEYQAIIERYGQAPPEFLNLYHLLQLQHAAAGAGIIRLESRIIKPLDRPPFCKVIVSTTSLPNTLRLLNRLGQWEVKDDRLIQEIPNISDEWVKKVIGALSNKHIQS